MLARRRPAGQAGPGQVAGPPGAAAPAAGASPPLHTTTTTPTPTPTPPPPPPRRRQEGQLAGGLPGHQECAGRGARAGHLALCAAVRHLRAEAAAGVPAGQAQARGRPAGAAAGGLAGWLRRRAAAAQAAAAEAGGWAAAGGEGPGAPQLGGAGSWCAAAAPARLQQPGERGCRGPRAQARQPRRRAHHAARPPPTPRRSSRSPSGRWRHLPQHRAPHRLLQVHRRADRAGQAGQAVRYVWRRPAGQLQAHQRGGPGLIHRGLRAAAGQGGGEARRRAVGECGQRGCCWPGGGG